jgi:hypothetical protein
MGHSRKHQYIPMHKATEQTLQSRMQWRTLYEILGGSWACSGKFLKSGPRKWHLQHSESTFCKKLGFQNTVVNNGIKLQWFN